MTVPRATLRLQFHKNFTFAHAARPGSMHGYDVIDPTRVNPELGGEDGLRALVAALREAGLGLIVDIVPNHMAVGPGNAWWWDVLQHGRASAYAHFFAIDWEPDASDPHGKMLAPFLGRSCAEEIGRAS